MKRLILPILFLILCSSFVFAVDYKVIDEKHSIIDHSITLEMINTAKNDLLEPFTFDILGYSHKFKIINPKFEIKRTEERQQPVYTFLKVEITCPKNETKQKCFKTDRNITNYETIYTSYWENVGVIKTDLTTRKTKLSNDFFLWKETIYIIKISWETPLLSWGSSGEWNINPSEWWNTSWNYCRNVTINNNVGSTLIDFPVLINITSLGNMSPVLDDLRFINNSCNNAGSELSYEIDTIVGDSALIWLKIPSFISGDNVIGMYYNNSDASNGEDITNVWVNYTLVWHMGDNNTASISDSTSHNNDGSKLSANNPIESSTKKMIGKAQDFSSDYIETKSSFFDIGAGKPITMEAWAESDSIGVNDYVWGSNPVYFRYGNENKGSWCAYYTSATGWIETGIAPDNDPNYFVMRWDLTDVDLLLNDLGVKGTDANDPSWTNRNLVIGAEGNKGDNWDGWIDEVRMSNVARSDDWINMSYQIVNSQSSLVIIGSEQLSPVPDSPILDIIFLNSTDEDTLTFDSAEELRPQINLTLSGVYINDSNCTLSFQNGLFETKAGNQNFTLCNSGCDYSTYNFIITDLSTTNAVADSVRMKLCYPQVNPQDLKINATCGVTAIERTISSGNIPSCEDGTLEFVLNNSVCYTETGIEIDFNNDAPNSQRLNVLDLEHNREFSVLDINLTYNFTSNLYEDNSLKYYDSGEVNITASCINPDDTQNATEIEAITISNIHPKVYHTNYWIDSVVYTFDDNVTLNISDLNTIIFFTSVFDENFLNATHLINISNGSNVFTDVHLTAQVDNHSFVGSFFIQDNYTFTTKASDTAGLITNLTTNFEILKYIPAPNMVSVAITPVDPVYIGDNLNCSAKATDDFNTSLMMSFEWYEDGIIQNAYSVNKTALNNTLTYTDILINTTDQASWVCHVRVFGTSYSTYLNATRSILNPLPPTLTCFYDRTPYIKDLDKIEWICLIEKQAEDDSPTSAVIDCSYDKTPYIKDLDRIEWLCSINNTG